MSEALARLAKFASEGEKSLLPHLNGQRIAALKDVVTGELSREGVRIAPILHEFEGFQRIRTFVCHGAASVLQEPDGLWRMELTLLNFASARVERGALTLGEVEAGLSLTRLRSARVRLEGQLSGLLEIFRRTSQITTSHNRYL